MSPKLSEMEKEQRRQQIIEAAKRVFIRKGYEKSTLKDIVEEAEMSRGWIYLYYTNKIEIFLAMLDQLDEQMAEELSALQTRHSSVLGALREFIHNTKAAVASARESLYPAIYEFFITNWRDPKLSGFFETRYERIHSLFESLLQRGIDSGEFRSDAPISLIAKRFMSAIDGILIHVLAFGSDTVHSLRQMEELADSLEHQLL